MNTKEVLLAWMEQYKDGHYVFDVYGEEVTVDLPRQTVEAVLDIAVLLVDRVVAAKGELATAEYQKLEETVRKEKTDEGSWLLRVVMKTVQNDHLFDRYKDIEPMIGELMPRGYPMGSMAYLLLVRPAIYGLICAVIRHVDDAEENYESLVYTFFIGILAKCWGEGLGWSKAETGNWIWHSSKLNLSEPTEIQEE